MGKLVERFFAVGGLFSDLISGIMGSPAYGEPFFVLFGLFWYGYVRF